MSWPETVVQSITGPGGDILREATGVSAAAEPPLPADVAPRLVVEWDDPEYGALASELGADAPRVLYSAMFAHPLPGTADAVAAHFGTRAQRAHAMKVFLGMLPHLVVERKAACALPPPTEEEGAEEDDPVGAVSRALGLTSLADRKRLAQLLLTHYLPGEHVAARTYLEGRLRLRPFHRELLGEWVAARPALAAGAWAALGAEIGGFKGLPSALTAWHPVAQPASLAVAMTQPNAAALYQRIFRAPGRLAMRRMRAAQAELRAAMPDLGAWVLAVAE